MHRCQGLHCDGCRHGGGAGLGIGALLVLLSVLVYAAHHRAIDHAASATGHVLVEVLAITAITLTVAAVTAGAMWAVRASQQSRRRATAALRTRATQSCTASEQPAVEVRPDGSLRALPSAQRVVQVRPDGSMRVLPGWRPKALPPAGETSISWPRTRGEQGQ